MAPNATAAVRSWTFLHDLLVADAGADQMLATNPTEAIKGRLELLHLGFRNVTNYIA